MLEAIRAFGAGPLTTAELTELGRVNVICGKNNSGKSTLLGALNHPEKRAAGRRVTTDLREKSVAAIAAASVYRDSRAKKIYVNVLEELIQTRDRWFANDHAYVMKTLSDRIERNPVLNEYAANYDYMAGKLLSCLVPADPKTILVPPKRQVDTERAISLSEGITPFGGGLVNYLFYAKNQSVTDSDRKVFAKMLSAFHDISSGFAFDAFPSRDNTVSLRFARPGGEWVPADACGLGLQDLLLLLYFGIASNADILLIEEPESHLHPDMQRRLLSFFRSETTKQLFVTTHSNVFLNNALIDRVLFTTFQDGRITVDDATSRASILDDLGYSVTDNLVSDLVILVEGPSDVPVIEELLVKVGVLGQRNVKIWPLGGDIMDQVDLSIFAERYQLIALVDRDPDSARVRKRFEHRCKEAGIEVHRLARYAIENYFTLSAITAVYPHQALPPGAIDLKPNEKVEKQLGFSVKRSSRAIAKTMEWSDIEPTDLGEFVKRVQKLVGVTPQ